MRKYKILFVDHAPFIGGAQLALVRHLRFLDKNRFASVVVCSESCPSQLRREWQTAGGSVTAIPFGRFKVFPVLAVLRALRTFFSLLGIIAREQPDLIVANTERAAYPVLLTGKLLQRKVIFWVRDFEYPRALLKFLALWVDGFVFVSRTVRDYYRFTAQPKAHVVYVGTDLLDGAGFNRPDWSSADSPADLSGLRKAVTIGYAGRLVAWKGVQALLEAVSLLKKDGRPFKVLIAGEGQNQEGENIGELKELVRRSHIEEVVTFVGFQKNMISFYRSLDIFVHPSLHPEPFATVVVEAMAVGLPVVAANAGGTSEIIHDGQNGLLFPSGNVQSLVKCLRSLLANGEWRQRLGEQGRLTVAENFTEAKVTREMEDIYRKVLTT